MTDKRGELRKQRNYTKALKLVRQALELLAEDDMMGISFTDAKTGMRVSLTTDKPKPRYIAPPKAAFDPKKPPAIMVHKNWKRAKRTTCYTFQSPGGREWCIDWGYSAKLLYKNARGVWVQEGGAFGGPVGAMRRAYDCDEHDKASKTR